MSMADTLNKRLSVYAANLTYLQEQLPIIESGISRAKAKLHLSEQALAVFSTTNSITQANLEKQLCDITTAALAAVFDTDPYTFKMNFVERRNTIECDLVFERGGHEISPFDDSGFGVIDVASFALRISFWRFSKTRPIIVMDEPFRNLDRAKHTLLAELVRRLCEELGVQVIAVSHIPELAAQAHNNINVVMKKGVSNVV